MRLWNKFVVFIIFIFFIVTIPVLPLDVIADIKVAFSVFFSRTSSHYKVNNRANRLTS